MVKKDKLKYIIGFAIISISFFLVAFLVLNASGAIDTRPKLVFASGTLEKEYDGTPLKCDKWELTGGKLKKGYTADVAINAERTDAGISLNHFTVGIYDEAGIDVTDSYNIISQPGNLIVTPCILSIRTDSATKEYDGTALICDSYKIVKGGVLSGHNLSVNIFGERTDAGISDNAFAISVTDNNGNDISHNYNAQPIYGLLTVTKINISIATPSYHSIYNAKPISGNEWEYASDTQILKNHQIQVTVSGTQTDVGVSKNSIAEVRITDGGKNVTDNYSVTYIEGDLIITPRHIVIRTESGQKPYDGTPLKNGNWKYASQTKIVEGETITVIVSGTRTNVGESPNTVAEVIIKTGGGKDVTFNYGIKLQEGSLHVTGTDTEPGAPGSSGSGGFKLNDSGKIGGGMGEVGDNESGDYNGRALRVYSDLSGKIYLRYMSFGDYTGVKWEAAADYQHLIDSKYSLNYLTGIALKNAGYSSFPVLIETAGGDYLLPYYLDTDELSYKIQTSDVKYTGSTSSIYSAYYYLFDYESEGLAAPSLGAYTALEAQYYDYVLNTYLSIPAGTNAFLQDIIDNYIGRNNPDIISAAAQYIRSAAVYNESYDKNLDAESDIAVSFLSQYREGICQHFATAATMLYRALGIPARYVIGYAGDTKGGEWVDISAKNAHAWVEVYLSGIGWVQIEVTAAMPEQGDGGNGSSNADILNIKPVDLSMQYKNGVVLEAGSQIQGISGLLAKGYSYKVQIAGKQTIIGVGYSTITSFVLYNPLGIDVTDDYKINFVRGKLHLYAAELTITSETLVKVYDGTPLFSDEGGYAIIGRLIAGHRINILESTGRQTQVGQSDNSCNLRIVDGLGNDVTDMYKINKNFGTLTVKARAITITAESASKAYDGTELTCTDYKISSQDGTEPLVENDLITVQIAGSQTNIGKSQNEISSVKIFDQDGREVTGNYSIEYLGGWLEVTRP